MTTITREQQKQILIDTANHVISRDNTSPYSENLRELARIALSALKNAPLALSDNQGRPRALVVPPAIEPDYKVIKSILPTANPDEYACCIAADMWNACRAAMLNGDTFRENPISSTNNFREISETSTNSPVIPEEIEPDSNNTYDYVDGWNACRAAMLQANQRDLSQPVDPQVAEYEQIMLQAGWVMVPIEPTDEMIAAAMECDDVVFDSKDPTAFCVQFREIYCAMVDAAPKPEVNSESN